MEDVARVQVLDSSDCINGATEPPQHICVLQNIRVPNEVSQVSMFAVFGDQSDRGWSHADSYCLNNVFVYEAGSHARFLTETIHLVLSNLGWDEDFDCHLLPLELSHVHSRRTSLPYPFPNLEVRKVYNNVAAHHVLHVRGGNTDAHRTNFPVDVADSTCLSYPSAVLPKSPPVFRVRNQTFVNCNRKYNVHEEKGDGSNLHEVDEDLIGLAIKEAKQIHAQNYERVYASEER
mmetsp:Transcript_9405/g.19118  ORF Transcript_9405/g.19118 Transcript_9405/m.19118 type:complete len:233 (+) Transcript_9405:1343-2041(+)